MKKIELRSAYNYDMDKVSKETGLTCPEPTLTQQQFAEETDINFIANQFGLTGELPQVLELPKYGDFEGIFDFQSAQNAVRSAMEQFMQLPARLRGRFDNQPQKLLDFLEDPENTDEAIRLGLMQKRAENPPEPPTGDPAPKGKGETPTPAPKGAGDPSKTAT